jgi:hypothetical protein
VGEVVEEEEEVMLFEIIRFTFKYDLESTSTDKHQGS